MTSATKAAAPIKPRPNIAYLLLRESQRTDPQKTTVRIFRHCPLLRPRSRSVDRVGIPRLRHWCGTIEKSTVLLAYVVMYHIAGRRATSLPPKRYVGERSHAPTNRPA